MVFLSRIFSRLYYCVSISIYRGFCVSNEETPSSSSSSDQNDTKKQARATPQNMTGAILIVRVCGSSPRIRHKKNTSSKRCTCLVPLTSDTCVLLLYVPCCEGHRRPIVLHNMNNSKHNACADTLFRAFSCEGICLFPGCEKQIFWRIGKARISWQTRALTLMQSSFFECLKTL